jgi:hypothetical protein
MTSVPEAGGPGKNVSHQEKLAQNGGTEGASPGDGPSLKYYYLKIL